MHTNKNTSSKTKQTVKTDKNDDENEMCKDEGLGFKDRKNSKWIWFDSVWPVNYYCPMHESLLGGYLKDIDTSLVELPEMKKSLDDENNQKVVTGKTIDSNEVKSEALSTVNEEENDSRSKRSKKIPTRYLNYELHVNWSFVVQVGNFIMAVINSLFLSR